MSIVIPAFAEHDFGELLLSPRSETTSEDPSSPRLQSQLTKTISSQKLDSLPEASTPPRRAVPRSTDQTFGDVGDDNIIFGDFGREKPGQLNLTNEQKLENVGNQLYELIHPIQPVMAAKITGMLLQNDLDELARLLQDPDELFATVHEAVRVLREAMLVEQHWTHLITQPFLSPLQGVQDARLENLSEEQELIRATIREQEHMARCFYTQEEYEKYVFSHPMQWSTPPR